MIVLEIKKFFSAQRVTIPSPGTIWKWRTFAVATR
jgi:hypothetical protein